jgi:hypothetical protein
MTSSPLVSAAIQRISHATKGHKPGEIYFLSCEAFSRFWREELRDHAVPNANHGCRINLWESIGAYEARRAFAPNWEYCHSKLFMTSEAGGVMQWHYETRSGTEIYAVVPRDTEPTGLINMSDVLDKIKNILEWNNLDSDDPVASFPADGLYAVRIPASRDLPGRNSWIQLRLAIAGLDHRSWYQEYGVEAPDEIAQARLSVKELLGCAP